MIETMDAAIQWHYVADGLPTRNDTFLVSSNSLKGVVTAWFSVGRGKFEIGHLVYAWAERPPKAPYPET